MKVIVADDVLATGGTVSAVIGLLNKLGANVCRMLLPRGAHRIAGREHLKGQKIFSLLQFEE